MAVQVNRVSSRYLSLCSCLVRQIGAIDDEVHVAGGEVVLPHRVEGIIDVCVVLRVEDCRVAVVKEERRIGQIPTEGAMRCGSVQIGSEGEVVSVALKVRNVPWHNGLEVRRALIDAQVAAVVGVGLWCG